MATTDRVVDPINQTFQVTTASGNPRTAPVSTNLPVRHGRLVAVEVYIPKGHWGVTGFALQLSGVTILPYSAQFPWIIGNDDRIVFDVDVEVDTKLTAVTFNEGNYPHSHYVRCQIKTIADRVTFGRPQLVALEGGAA